MADPVDADPVEPKRPSTMFSSPNLVYTSVYNTNRPQFFETLEIQSDQRQQEHTWYCQSA